MKTIAYLFLLLGFALLGVAADNASESQTDDIREAVFRWQFDHTAFVGQQINAQIYFLSIGEKSEDPKDEFLKRFADHKPPVRKVSACTGYDEGGVFDKKTGQRGLLFRVAIIEWKSDTEVEVRGGYRAAGLSGTGNTYTLKRETGKWKVTNDRMDSIK